MSTSIERLLMIVAVVMIAVISAVALYGISKSSASNASDKSTALRDIPKIYMLSPSNGEQIVFKKYIIDGKQYYGAIVKVYSDRKLKNDAIPIAISDVPISHILIYNETEEEFNDGTNHYHYLYTLLVLVDPKDFEVAKQKIGDTPVYIRYAGAQSMNTLAFAKITVDETSEPEVLSFTLSYPTIYVYLFWDGSKWQVDHIVLVPDSATQPTVKAITSGSGGGSGGTINTINLVYNDGSTTYNDTFTSTGSVDSNGYPVYTGKTYSGYSEGDTVEVYVNNVSAGTTTIVVSQTNDDGSVSPMPEVDNSKFFFLDGNGVLHYRIVNGDPQYNLDIEKTSDNETAFRWVAVQIEIYSGSSRSDALSKQPAYNLSATVVAGRTSFELGSKYTEVRDDEGNLLGYILSPNGYIQEKVDLSSFLTQGNYYVVKVTFYVNGYLWNATANDKTNIPYQETFGPYEIDVDLTSSTTETTSDSTVQSTTTSSSVTVNYLTFFVMNNIDTYSIATDSVNLSVMFVEYEGVDSGNNYVSPSTPNIIDFISDIFAKDNGGYDLGLLIDATDETNYASIYKQSDVTDTTLEKGHTLAIKVEESQLPYGIYQLNVSDEVGRYLFSSYFLWDGVDILWLDVDKNIGNYYSDFPYKKDYSISYNENDVLVGYQVLVYLLFTKDVSDQPYVTGVTVNENVLGIDLNGDGDTSDTVQATVFEKAMYDSLMTLVSSTDGSISNEEAWKTKYVGIRFTYVQDGIGEMEIPFYIEDVLTNDSNGYQVTLPNGTAVNVYVAKIWVRMPVLRNSATGDNNGGYIYWYGEPYNIDGTLASS